MRNISFALTASQFKARTKTQTRRLGWTRLKPGDRLMGCVKCMGLKPGESLERLGEIRVTGVRREELWFMKTGDCAKEGFPEMNVGQFVEMFCRHMKCEPQTVVTVIDFEYVEATGEPGR